MRSEKIKRSGTDESQSSGQKKAGWFSSISPEFDSTCQWLVALGATLLVWLAFAGLVIWLLE